MNRRSQRAFTLLELLLSLALMALLFAAMSQLLFSMGDLWGRGAERRLFERHATAVAQHLQEMLLAAAPGPKGSPAITVAGYPDAGDPGILTLALPDGDRLFTREDRTAGGVVCSLQVDQDRGLLLHWSFQFEPGSAEVPARLLVMTPFVRGVAYEYYDRATQNWFGEDSLQRDGEGRWLMPVRLQLRFVWDKYQAIRTVTLPGAPGALPAF